MEFEIPEIIGFEEQVVITRVYESHDGLVRQKDAELPIGMGQIIYNYPIPDLNHMAMCANFTVQTILDGALNQGLNGSAFTYTEQ